MKKGKHEPHGSDSFIYWQESNWYRWIRYAMEECPPDTCEWEYNYSDWAFCGGDRPSDEVITKMFDNKICSEFECAPLGMEQSNRSNNSNSSNGGEE